MIQTQYITLDEFQEYFGEDLRKHLGTEENALAFLKRIEDRLEIYIDANFNRNINKLFGVFNNEQKSLYKKALLEQAMYVFRNGDISVDSGIDIDRGKVIERSDIIKTSISPNTYMYLRKIGLTNRCIYKGW